MSFDVLPKLAPNRRFCKCQIAACRTNLSLFISGYAGGAFENPSPQFDGPTPAAARGVGR
ncbi:hypothetical protein [Pseudorhodobacter ferrugineus]|uniref:hypothetical protein n=1 Tax=Pseudorhodobacter ferrugineus TaxID=77008 RepID=UPI0003FC9E45|nr:hypothetical protein [Pseudorhodobacter ferrugineus]